ncbi:MAG: ABC transporter permease [Bifidobacteriaceae bacterium]|jgi:ABC-2 type transport system permease protein|nr:ABC transporter permease [Bifidobacteriaceae bacterium]
MNAAIRVEALKLVRSPVGTIGTLALVVGTLALLGGITAALASGNPELTAKAGSAATLDWNGLLANAAQITAVGALLGFGVVLSWMFGREFTDGTITGLFALPVSRHQIALAKLAVYVVWAIAVSIVLTLGFLALGLVLGYYIPTADTWAGIAIQGTLGMLTAAIAVPAALIATLARSVLAAIGSVIALVVLAQVGVLTGAGGWMPLAAPALWAISDGANVSPAQLALAIAVGVVFSILTAAGWARLQLDR